jgi:hypothetical protein
MALRWCLFLVCAMSMPAAGQNDPPLNGMPCLQVANIAEYHPIADKRSLVVIDRQHKQYLLTFAAACESLQPQTNLGFSTINPSQYSCIARGDSVFSSNDVGAHRLCRIQSIKYFNERPPDQIPGPTIITGGRTRG